MRISPKKLICAAVTAVLTVASVGMALAMHTYKYSFSHEHVAERFSGGERFAQITVFASEQAELTYDKILYFRYNLEKKLTEKSLTPPNEGARLYADAFSTFEDVTLSSDGTRTAKAKLAYIGGDYRLFYELYEGMPDIDGDINHDRMLLSRSAAWQLYGGESLYDYPVSVGDTTYYVSGVYADYDETESVKAFYGDRVSAAADLMHDTARFITCYDLIVIDPVKNFALDTVKECLELPEGTYLLVENSSRFSLANLFRKIPTLVESDEPLPTGVDITPEETEARHAEKILAVMLMLLIVLSVWPLLRLCVWVFRLGRAVKRFFERTVVRRIKDKFSYS